MPMDEVYDKKVDCDIADLKNVGAGRGELSPSLISGHYDAYPPDRPIRLRLNVVVAKAG